MHQSKVQILYICKKRDAVIKQATDKAVADALDAAEKNHQQALKNAGYSGKDFGSQRLPEQKLRVYKGVLEDWFPWWEEFDAAVH